MDELYQKYIEIYHKEIVPSVKIFENKRIKLKRQIDSFFKIIYPLEIILYIFLCIKIPSFECRWIVIFGLFLFFFSFPGIIVYFLQKNFENKVKSFVMPLMLKPFGNFKWINSKSEELVTKEDINKSGMLYRTNFIQKSDDDKFIGKYKDIQIKICETNISAGKHNDFTGLLVLLEIPKNFSGHTLICGNNPLCKQNPNNIGMKINLESIDFNDKFHVFSTDQVEARYIITPSFMERFINLTKIFGPYICSYFYENNKVLITIQSLEVLDFFSIGNIKKTMADKEQFIRFFNEFYAILSIIDELKLYCK